ncbi:MAG: NUDIX hydrolase [Candidatus Nanohalobium sp.]
MKCIECGDQEIEKIDQEGKEKYRCSKGHVNERVIDNQGLEYYRECGDLVHRTVGVIVKHRDEILLLKRRKYPYSYTIPAGHLEQEEDPDKAVKRELKEETGVEAGGEEFNQVFRGRIEDPCRRGCDIHDWNLYIYRPEQKPSTKTNDEAEKTEWVQTEDISRKELTRPTEKFLVEKDLISDME